MQLTKSSVGWKNVPETFTIAILALDITGEWRFSDFGIIQFREYLH